MSAVRICTANDSACCEVPLSSRCSNCLEWVAPTATTQNSACTKSKAREAFEAFVSSELGDVAVADEGRYISPKIQNYWLTWQAATDRAMAEAVKACEADRLDDTTGTEGDAAYNRAIGHCITAIKEALK